MVHFIYRVTNNINDRFYIGKHSTNNIDDGYFGSGIMLKQALKKYGKENFIYEIIEFFCTSKEAYAFEEGLLRDVWNTPMCYNQCGGGKGVGGGKTHPLYGKSHSKETKKKMSVSKTGEKNFNWGLRGKNTSRYGVKHSEEAKKKMSLATKKKIIYQFNKFTGVFICEFASLTEAAKSVSKNWESARMAISNCAYEKTKSSFGFIWSYEKVKKYIGYSKIFDIL